MDNEVQRLKTGTTTIGIVCKDGVILAADMRITAGYMIVGKVEKVVSINDRIAVTIAGTVSDIQLLKKLLSAEVKLKEIRTGREVSVKEAANLLSGMLYTSLRQYFPGIAHFVMAGVDSSGSHCYDCSPDGALKEVDDYVSSGSGSIYAYGVLESQYKENISLNDGIDLARTALETAMKKDIASGQGIVITTISKDGIKEVEKRLVSYELTK